MSTTTPSRTAAADDSGDGTTAPAQAPPPAPDRTGVVSIWVIIGLAVLLLVTQGWGRWILSSEEFSPVTIMGPDEYPTWREVILRVTEALSIVEMSLLIYFTFIKSWRATGRFGLDAKITTGLLLGSFTDGILNTQEYLFAWNQHSINMGSWARFVPLNDPEHASRYAEALIWGIPQYTYYCITVAMVACAVIQRRRAINPALSNAKCYMTVFAGAFVFDFILENFLIRVEHSYAYAQTPASLTLWAGTHYQFPIYESVLVASLGVAFTALRLSAIDHPKGLSFPERGLHRLPARLQGPASWLSVIGFCFVCLLFIYHVPFQILGLIGDSNTLDVLPSYMLPNDL
ncbi:MAG: spirocyclase AveC family protein [Solirubrobacteraceae bacterium]|nr:spirocyclase AveC family protein [Solirubrobacteraceae bacterium]